MTRPETRRRPIPYTATIKRALHREGLLCCVTVVAWRSRLLRGGGVRIYPQVGSLVYARVVAADRDLEPELSCTDAQGKVCGLNRRREVAVRVINQGHRLNVDRVDDGRRRCVLTIRRARASAC